MFSAIAGQLVSETEEHIPLNPFQPGHHPTVLSAYSSGTISEDIPLIQLSSSPPPDRPDEESGSGEVSSFYLEEFDELLRLSSSDDKKTTGSEDVLQIQNSNIILGADVFRTEDSNCREAEECLEGFVAHMDQMTEPDLIVFDDEECGKIGAGNGWEAAQQHGGNMPLAPETVTHAPTHPFEDAATSGVLPMPRVFTFDNNGDVDELLIDFEFSDDDDPIQDYGNTLNGYEDVVVVDAKGEPQSGVQVVFRKNRVPEKFKKMGTENFVDPQTRPPPGIITANNTPFHEFKLCNVNGPGLFYLADMTNSSVRDAMEDEMTNWYHEYYWEKHLARVPEGTPIGSFEHMSFHVKDGGYYAAFVKSVGKWVRCRAEVLQGLGDESLVLVHLLDHGTQALVSNNNILPLRREYLELPIQAYAGTLKGLDSESGGDLMVDGSTAKKFRVATEGQTFLVHIMENHASESDTMTKLTVVILGKIHVFKGEIPIIEFALPGYKRVM